MRNTKWDCSATFLLEGESIFLPFLVLEAASIPWLMDPHHRSFASVIISSLTLTLLFPSYNYLLTHYDYIRVTQVT